MSRTKSIKSRSVKFSILIAVFSITLVACNTLPVDSTGTHKARSSSSLVSYLYPNGERPPGLASDIPQLTVPVRIGIAFVPEQNSTGVISERVKNRLLRKVRNAFKHHTVVQEIRILPIHSLRTRGGFRELRQLADRYNVDLIALVSHNQVRAVRHNALSVSYVTIVGAIILPGNSHDVSTFVNTAVFDVSSGKLLFHAAGKDRVRRQTSAFALAEKNRLISRRSIGSATQEMIASLNTELYKGNRMREARSVDEEYFNRNSGRNQRYRRPARSQQSRRNNDNGNSFDESGGNR